MDQDDVGADRGLSLSRAGTADSRRSSLSGAQASAAQRGDRAQTGNRPGQPGGRCGAPGLRRTGRRGMPASCPSRRAPSTSRVPTCGLPLRLCVTASLVQEYFPPGSAARHTRTVRQHIAKCAGGDPDRRFEALEAFVGCLPSRPLRATTAAEQRRLLEFLVAAGEATLRGARLSSLIPALRGAEGFRQKLER